MRNLIGSALLALSLGGCLSGCAAFKVNPDATVDDKLKFINGIAEVSHKHNLPFEVEASYNGDSNVYSKQSFGLDTGLEVKARISSTGGDYTPPALPPVVPGDQ